MSDVVLKGQALDLEPIEKFINAQIQRWQVSHPDVNGWSIFTGKISFREVLVFLMESADDLVVLVESLVFKGEDKKATVIAALDRLYDTIIEGVLPIWLKPFSGMIKYITIHLIIDKMIDYIVSKYNDGSQLALAMAWKVKTN